MITSHFILFHTYFLILDAQKSSLYAGLDTLSILPELHTPLLRYTTSLFLAGDMPLWLGLGLKFLRRIWNIPSDLQKEFTQTVSSFTMKFHLCLADTGWSGWKLVALPLIFKFTSWPELRLMERHQKELITFLSALKKGRKLGSPTEVDLVWKKKIEAIILGRLKSAGGRTRISEEEVRLCIDKEESTNGLYSCLNWMICLLCHHSALVQLQCPSLI